jgi:(E)-4-hydroxy-3-methylbut-2-enyl-diphosphate synthase
MDYFNYHRRPTIDVRIGNITLGGNHPVVVQTMTNTNTLDTEGSVAQCERIIAAGADLIRLTTQGVREAENLRNIHRQLREKGYTTPLSADIHFNPRAAHVAATVAEKVRINPGNFVDKQKTFAVLEYSDEEYRQELEKIRSKVVPFLQICKEHGTAVRIGVNHGSLSDRIMTRFGDTPEGMVESCMEYLRIALDEGFTDIVISMKASNTLLMTKAVRLLVDRMDKEDIHFPLHLGVTEAGDGEDGRMKSAVGIGALLSDGLGDTVRVSLSEDPEAEVPVARKIVNYVAQREGHEPIKGELYPGFSPFSTDKRETRAVRNIGGGFVPVVISDRSAITDMSINPHFIPDYIYVGRQPLLPLFYPHDRIILAVSLHEEDKFARSTLHESRQIAHIIDLHVMDGGCQIRLFVVAIGIVILLICKDCVLVKEKIGNIIFNSQISRQVEDVTVGKSVTVQPEL